MLKVRLLVVAVVGALVFSAAAFAAQKTTGPGTRVDVYIHITPKAFISIMYTKSNYKGGDEQYLTDPSEVTRGQIARFHVLNATKKTRTFTLFGKTRTLKPGAQPVWIVPLIRRGSFPYVSTAKGAKPLKGVFLVN